MQIKRLIISAFLLVAYTFGFAHELIPHCHHVQGLTGIENADHEHQHLHHMHPAGEAIDHDHISHDDHLDSGLFDFLICMLSSVDHSDPLESSSQYLPAQLINSPGQWLTNMQLATMIISLVNVELEHVPVIHARVEIPTFFLSPPISGISHRGPPVISC